MNEGTPTTLVQPAFDHIIERPRLISILEEADARVVIFAAPAGYGKTTLARQWSARQTGPVVWHRTTRASGDVTVLAVRLDEALAKAAPGVPRDPKRIPTIARVNGNPGPLGRALISIYGSLGRDVLVVMDEWESAGTEEAEELLSMLVESLDVRFLITTRTRPAWFSPRLEVYGEGIQIGVDELAMTDEEARVVLGRERSLKDQTAIVATARGWPAVLGLASMRATDLPHGSVAGGMLFEYLATELLQNAADSTRRGLMLAAAAGITDVPTLQLLLGDETERLLAEVVRLGLARTDNHSTFDIHPLLRDLLLQELTRLPNSEEPALVGKLSRLIDHQRWEEVLTTAERFGAPPFVARALEEAVPQLLERVHVGTLRRWVAVADQSGSPGGLIHLADAEVALREGAFDRAIARGKLATKLLQGDLAARAHLVVAGAGSLSDQPPLIRRHLSRAIELAESPDTRAAALWAAFVEAVDEERADAATRLHELEEQSVPNREQLLRLAHGSIRLALVEGGLESAHAEAQSALPLLQEDVDPMVGTSFLNLHSGAAAFSARYAESLELAERELVIAEAYELDFVSRHALINKARAAVGLRQIRIAEQALAELDRRLEGFGDPFIEANKAIERSRLYITIGDLTRAHEVLTLDLDKRIHRGARAEHLALRALVLAAQGDRAAALREIAEARRVSRMAEVRCLTTAATLLAHGSTSQSEASLFIQMVSDLGTWDAVVVACRASLDFARLLTTAGDVPQSSLRKLFLASNDSAIARKLGVTVPRAARPVTRLSPREQEIHELIAQGMTNPEIARLLFISESTTKVHVRHILEKLGVRSRVEATRVWRGAERERG